MSGPPAPSFPSTAKIPRKQKKKGQQARKLKHTTRGTSLAFYNASVATIPNQSRGIKIIRGSFLELPGGTSSIYACPGLVAYNHDAEVRNQIYDEYVQECVGSSAWLDALELGNTCKQVRTEFLPVFISSLEKLWFRLDKFTELLDICCSPTSTPFILDELEKQGKTFKINIDDYRKVGVLSIFHMVLQLRERPSMKVRFKDTYLRTCWQGGTSRNLNRVIKALCRRPVGPDDILSNFERLEIKAPGVTGVCFSPREVAVAL